jgi:hypothetical protein
MTYICLECGHIFDDGEQSQWVENRGEFWGMSCHEGMSGCPKCRGDYEKSVPCAICGSEHLEEDLVGGVCEECISEYKNDFDMCYKVCGGEKDEIKLNALLVSLFDVADIEAILYQYVKNNCPDIDCTPFIENDESWFADRLIEEVKKDENKKKQSR